MAQQSEGGGMRGPERPKLGTPSARSAGPEPASTRGAAYTPPPAAEGPSGPGGGSGMGRWWIAAALGLVLIGGVVFRERLGFGTPATTAAVQVASHTLQLGAADIDPVATALAKRLIADGQLPPPPPSPEPATTSGTPANAAPAAQSRAATPAPVAASPKPAPVVHRPRPKPNTPAPATPAPVPAAETEQAVRAAVEQAPAEVRQAIAEGNTVIYTLHVLDDVAEDGDVVEVFVNGVSQGQVNLTSAGQDLLVPLPSGSTANVHVVALQDGGGGVTFGVVSSMGEIRSTVMAVGGSDDWSVTIQ